MIPQIFKRYKAETLLLGDVLIFWISLAAVVAIRYDFSDFHAEFSVHEGAFFPIMLMWIFVMYVADLYSYQKWRANLENAGALLGAIGINFILSISVFYAFGSFFKLTPKLNLALFVVLFTILDCGFRYVIARLLASRGHRTQILFLSDSPLVHLLTSHINKHPQLGYAVVPMNIQQAVESMRNNEKKIVVVDDTFLREDAQKGLLYSLRSEYSQIETLAGFFERVLNRVPLEEISEEWIVREIRSETTVYASLKRGLDLLVSAVLLIVLLPVFVVLAIIIRTTSEGSALFRQSRVGKNGRHFTLYKFRTMRNDAEKDGAQWSQKNDPRATKVGAFLRHTHLDELPQLWNIFAGDMSFVGPRPERPEFTETLAPQIPQYRLRETILPGLTGWAQIKFRYSNTHIEAREKFEYDLYYVKNKNFLLDIGIMAKTIQYVFKGQGWKSKK